MTPRGMGYFYINMTVMAFYQIQFLSDNNPNQIFSRLLAVNIITNKVSKGLFGDWLFFAGPFSALAFQNLVFNKADSHGFWDRVTVCHIN